MKLKKLVEATTKPTEAGESEDRINNQDLSDINPQVASETEIANALQNSIEDATDGFDTVSDTSAKSAATEIAAVADEINAGGVAIDPNSIPDISEDEVLGVENRLTKVLDLALHVSQRGKAQGLKKNANVLITGLPGSGKTAIVDDWASSKGIYSRTIPATDPDLEAAVYGLTLRDITKTNQNATAKAPSTFLNDSDEHPQSVLFLDEFNRANARLRRALLTLVNEKWVPDARFDRGRRYFPNLLFTVAAVNPGGLRVDKNAELLNDAEKSRFILKTKFDSNVETTMDYFVKHWNKAIKNLNKNGPDYLDYLEEYLRCQHLGLFIVQNSKFAYDTKEDLDTLYETGCTMFNQRELTDLLNACEGNAEDMKELLVENSEFLQRDIDMLIAILSKYQPPTLEQLIKLKNRDLGIDLAPSAEAVRQKDAQAAKPEEDDEEDDNYLFSGNAGKAPTLSNADVEILIQDAIDNLDSFFA